MGVDSESSDHEKDSGTLEPIAPDLKSLNIAELSVAAETLHDPRKLETASRGWTRGLSLQGHPP